jgi:hypothetical protein
MGRRLSGIALIVVGVAAFSACLRSAYTGMRDVIVVDGGSCASGGPYVVARQCSGTDTRLLLVGILGGLVAAAIYVAGTSRVGRPGSSAWLVCWAGMFGVLGWNFMRQVVHPAPGSTGTSGWLISGVVFWLLAAGGLVPLVGGLASDLRQGNKPNPIYANLAPVVQAGVPVDGGWLGAPVGRDLSLTGASAPGAAVGSIATWLLASLAGAALGLALSSSLLTLLR